MERMYEFSGNAAEHRGAGRMCPCARGPGAWIDHEKIAFEAFTVKDWLSILTLIGWDSCSMQDFP